MSSRRRLSPEQRRDELMDIGATLFTKRAYEDVTMEDVARQANTSRALVYHYFPSKPEFFAAIWKRAHDRLLSAVNFEGASSVRDSVAIALEAYLSFYEAHVALVVIANRSSIATDPVLRIPIAESMRALCERLLEASGIAGHARNIAAVALAGWIAFVREVTVEWLLDQRISRVETLDLCLAVLDVTLGSYILSGVGITCASLFPIR
ncbi:TetR/AcrR family transcriptional regulator [Mycobacterium sp. OTB74]|jgi:AcrR family transcriptional regulator|uniref:TetR/AcrR family transcriptional regulator n=1 Tax=Mycobacterium sp. OTB74 TaxID=1853452 RepID=UPI002474194C|nr:TetR/AcrR family transcriptional regulator [Mycobacterium sp. OTB74]MDH6244017.1 AcrR family transcriptional regulator [Mycobacterium sp. OTB74]